MPKYFAECRACNHLMDRWYSFAEWDLLKEDSTTGNKIMGVCELCAGPALSSLGGYFPEIIANGDIELKVPGYNISKGAHTDKQQEAIYASQQRALRKAATQTKALRKGGKRRHDEVRHLASIPMEVDTAMRRQTGDKHWLRNSGDMKKTLRRLGLLLDH